MDELKQLARDEATQHDLDPALFCAVIEQESSWNPLAIRYEPAFYERYIASQSLSPTEAHARAFSWGLCQLMGQTAREIGFKGKFLSELLRPEVGLEWGAKLLVIKIAKAKGDVHQGLLYWNGGGNLAYPDQVLARVPNYKEPDNVG